MKKLWRRKPYDPVRSGSSRQQEVSTKINEKLQSEKEQRRNTVEILVLGPPSATSRFLVDFDLRESTRPNPGDNDSMSVSTEDTVEGCASQKGINPTTGQMLDVAERPSEERLTSIESELAELAGDLYRMGAFSEYTSSHEGTHEVDVLASSYLLNAMYAKAGREDKLALRCAIRPESSVIENQVRHQTSTIDTRAIPSRSYPDSSFTFCLHLLGEHSPAHPKTCGFFEECRNVVFILDVNTLHELHPTGKVNNVVWAMHRMSTLEYRCSRRLICLNFSGVTKFLETMATRSADDYLAKIFDDYDPDGNTSSYDRPGLKVLEYVLQRFQALTDGNQTFMCFIGDDERRYAAIYEAIMEQYVFRYMVCTLH